MLKRNRNQIKEHKIKGRDKEGNTGYMSVCTDQSTSQSNLARQVGNTDFKGLDVDAPAW